MLGMPYSWIYSRKLSIQQTKRGCFRRKPFFFILHIVNHNNWFGWTSFLIVYFNCLFQAQSRKTFKFKQRKKCTTSPGTIVDQVIESDNSDAQQLQPSPGKTLYEPANSSYKKWRHTIQMTNDRQHTFWLTNSWPVWLHLLWAL